MSSPRLHSVGSCIGCREKASPTDLLRVVLGDGAVQPDPKGSLPGRGAWLHPTCLEIAERRKAFTRALRAPSAPSTSALKEFVSRMSISVAMDAEGHARDVDRVQDRGTEDEPPMSTQP